MRNGPNQMRKNAFNMIELALALGIVAIGIASIMVLFPVGLNAARDSMAETYAAESADQLLHYIQYIVRTPANWNSWISADGTTLGSLPGAKPTSLDADMTVSGAGVTDSDGTMFSQSTAGIYQIVRYVENNTSSSSPADNENEFNPEGMQSNWDDQVDFRGILAVWQEDIPLLDTDGDPATADNRNVGATLKVEVSWPAELPYQVRKKAAYQLEVFNRR